MLLDLLCCAATVAWLWRCLLSCCVTLAVALRIVLTCVSGLVLPRLCAEGKHGGIFHMNEQGHVGNIEAFSVQQGHVGTLKTNA